MKLSVIIPVYNVEEYLKKCLDSFVNQTEKDIEIICVDDGSTDNSLNILKEYENKYQNLHIYCQENQGGGVARNTGLKHANGEYVYFFDSDDWAELNLCEDVYKIATENQKPDIIKFHGYSFSMKNNLIYKEINIKSIPNYIYNKIINFEEYCDELLKYTAIPWNSFYKREFLISNNIEFSNLKCGNDISFFIDTLIKAKTIYAINKFYLYHRTNINSSLIGIRDRYFDCEFENYKILDNLTQNINTDLRTKILKFMMNDIYFWYMKFINKSRYNKQIYKNTKEFLKNIDLEIFSSDDKYLIYKIMKNGSFLACQILHVIKNFKIFIFNILKNPFIKQAVLKLIPKIFYPYLLKRWYKINTGKTLDLKHPKTFNEKIQWLKLYDSTPLKTKLADKYLVRNWVKEKIGEEYLIPLLGVWKKFDDIDFDKLPNQFVLKTNHGSGMNIIVKDKSKFDKKDAKQKFDKWLKINYAFKFGFELHYKNIKPLIIAEKYLENINGETKDYKFLCFDGEPKCIWVDSDRYSEHKRNVFDLNWNEQKITFHNYEQAKFIEKPVNLEKMTELSKILSEGFKHVRVDFYEVNNKVYFGEVTFTSSSGIEKISPHEFDLELGNLIHLPTDHD